MLVPTKDDLKPERQAGVSLWYIATRAGVGDRSENWVLNYARMLIENDGFPRPLPYYDLQGRKRPGVHLHSRWLRTAVDAWFDGFLPPHLVTVLEDRQSARDAQLLDERAGALCGAEGRRRADEETARAGARA